MSTPAGDFALLIDGEALPGSGTLEVINPATGAVFAQAPAAGRDELDRAVAAARRAASSWRELSFAERRACIERMAQVLREHQAELARLLTLEQGKPLAQARDEITRAATQSEGMARIALDTEVLTDDRERHIELRYVPLGVVGIITPWNAPINLAAGPLTAALYTGNTVVLKPSPYTPLAPKMMVEVMGRFVPEGVIGIVTGGNELGGRMTRHPVPRKISFTGSTATGKRVAQSAAADLTRLTLELGGNDAAIVLDDADPAAIAERIFTGAFRNSGQICTAIKRLYVAEALYGTSSRRWPSARAQPGSETGWIPAPR